MNSRHPLFGAGLVLALIALLLTAGPAAAKAPRAFFGITPQRGLEDDDFERMDQAQVGTLRFHLNWAGVDSAKEAPYDWSGPDRIVGQAAAHGIRTLPYALGTPDWVAALDGHDCAPDCARFAPRGKQAIRAWRNFLAAAVRRYGPTGKFWDENPDLPKLSIRVWQFWNEQNSETFYEPKPSVRAYAKLLHAGSKEVISEDRGAEIVLGGMFGTPFQGRKPNIAAWDFLAKLYKLGAKRDFDTVAPHPYAPTLDDVLLQVDLLRDEMRKAHDGGADLRITELGWASDGPKHPLNRGRRGQAERLKESFRYFVRKRKKLNLRSLSWYSWRDDPGGAAALCSWCPYSGLLDDELKPKPALRAFTKFTGGS